MIEGVIDCGTACDVSPDGKARNLRLEGGFQHIGTAMVYPTLLAAIGDVAHPSWRASSVGVYRLWRDLGYAIGALLAGIAADALGLPSAMWIVAALTFASGLLVALRMTETHKTTASVSPTLADIRGG